MIDIWANPMLGLSAGLYYTVSVYIVVNIMWDIISYSNLNCGVKPVSLTVQLCISTLPFITSLYSLSISLIALFFNIVCFVVIMIRNSIRYRSIKRLEIIERVMEE